MNEEFLIPIALFAMIGAIVIVPQYLKSKERQKMQDTLRVAYEKGMPVDPAIIQAMTSEVKSAAPTPYRDVRRGVVFLAIALALAVAGAVHGHYEGYDETIGWYAAAAFPGFIGLAFVLLGVFAKKRG